MKKEVQQLEVTTNLIRNLKGCSDEVIKRDGLDRKNVITASDKTVLVAISTWINVPNNLRNGLSPTHCWVSQEMICEQTLLSKRTVQDCINKLMRLGYLTQVKKGRTGVASEYEVNVDGVQKAEYVKKPKVEYAKPAPPVKTKTVTTPFGSYEEVDEPQWEFPKKPVVKDFDENDYEGCPF